MALVTSEARENGSGLFQYPKLTLTNYTSWVIRVKAMMEDQGVWEAIEPAAGEAVDQRKDKKARSHLLQALPEDLLMQVATKETSKEVWDCLKTRFIGAERVRDARMQTLKKAFDSMRMNEDETLDQYAGRITTVAVKYSSVGGTLDDTALVKKLFDTTPDRFLSVIAGIEQFYDLKTMPFEEALGRLKAYEERTCRGHGTGNTGEGQLLLTQGEWEARYKKIGGDSSSAHKNKSNSSSEGGSRSWGGRGRGRGNGRGGRRGSPRKEVANDTSGNTRDKTHIRCFNCNQYGHYANQCKVPKKKDKEEVNLTQTDDDELTLLLAVTDEGQPQKDQQNVVLLNEEKVWPESFGSGGNSKSTDIWYLDNGASNHMTGDKSKFHDLEEAVTGSVKFGDGSTVNIMGKGTIMFNCRGGDQWALQEVYYIPKLCSNLVSLGQLTETGHKVVMDEDELDVFIKSPWQLIMKVKRTKNRLYRLELKIATPLCLLANLEEPAWLWHARLGHVNFQSMKMLMDKEMATGVPMIKHPNQLCKNCLVTKQARHPFPGAAGYREKKPLGLLHADLCGPISPPTPAGNNYFMLIVDDFSRWMWIYVIKAKDQVYHMFLKFKAEAENMCGERIKRFRTDRGGEFLSNALKQFCEEAGIVRELTAPYSPQQNGVVERRNRTVMSMARSLLKSMNVPGRFWGEAVRHSVYLLNRLPTKSMGDRTPYEVWIGRKPYLGHLRVFGCTAHAKVTKPHLKKLDDRSQAMVYLGVEEGCKAHRLLDLRQGKIHVSRDVVFEENIPWQWSPDIGIGETPEFIIEEETGSWSNGVGMSLEENSISVMVGTEQNSPASQPSLQPDEATSASPPATPAGVQPVSHSDVDTSDKHVRYRSLAEIYTETQPMELREDALIAELEEPKCYKEAVGDPAWVEAMNEEIKSIERNSTWSLSQLPGGHKAIGLKWVFKQKKNSDGEVIKHKARVVAKGYVQQYGIDFEEVFAPVARLDTIRIILAIAANRGWQVHHLDVKSAFLNGKLKEEVYVAQPEGYEVKGKEHMVLRLHKALYGLRQAPRAWNTLLDKSLKELGFTRCTQDQAVYKREKNNGGIILGVYVDDLIVTGENSRDIIAFKQEMMTVFEMSDLGLLNFYLGIEVKQHGSGIIIKQARYAKKVLTQFGMLECNPTKIPMQPKMCLHKDSNGQPIDVTEYRRVIGCLRYLLHTRPDLSYSVGVLSRFMERPTMMHQNAIKQVLRYLKGTLNWGLSYPRRGDEEVISGYTDSDLAGDQDDRKSTGGMAFYLNEALVSWNSQKQKTVALSSCEAEFMAATTAACQALWLRNLLAEMMNKEPRAVKLYVDNKSAIALMKNPVFHGRSKHIDTRFHFIRECIEEGQIIVDYVRTEEQRADPLTKALPIGRLATMCHLLGIRHFEPHQD